ncbi:MAG TPA: hypothetical protein V6D08_05540 [Candidatus Obscuribacterales bacterium]
MGRDIQKEAANFHDQHKDLTGEDAPKKITEDFAKVTKGMTEEEKRAFCQALDHSDSVDDKVQYNFKDTDKDGVRDSLTVTTQQETWWGNYIPGEQREYKETNVTQEVEKLGRRPAEQRSRLEEGTRWGDKKTQDALVDDPVKGK